MELGLRGKAFLVTASARGIGRAVAGVLAAEGARVAICARSPGDVATSTEAIGGATAGHAGFVVDLSAEHGPAQLVAEVGERFGVLDGVVHNLGGTLAVRDSFAPLEAWRSVWRLNLEVMIELNASLIPAMRDRGWGRVVAIGSAAGVEHQGALPYAITKAALHAYVRGLGRELAASGVVVSAVVPGTVRTSGGVWDRRAREDPEAVERYVAVNLPAARMQAPEGVADAVAFLCSECAADFAGSIVSVDAGAARAFRSE